MQPVVPEAESSAGDLLADIMGFEMDDPASSLPFTRRLARENRWEIAYAVRVVREYKRFAYLAMRAGHPVTPSVAIDQAWHLHLLYTRSYWDEFCGGVLGQALHHGPTRGGQAEGTRYREQYSKTLESYAKHFGDPPPGDIWPSVDDNFAHVADWVFVNRRSVWLLPRVGVLLGRWLKRIQSGGDT